MTSRQTHIELDSTCQDNKNRVWEQSSVGLPTSFKQTFPKFQPRPAKHQCWCYSCVWTCPSWWPSGRGLVYGSLKCSQAPAGRGPAAGRCGSWSGHLHSSTHLAGGGSVAEGAGGRKAAHSVYRMDRRSVSVSVSLPAEGRKKGRGHLGWRRRRPSPPQCCDWSGPVGGGRWRQSLAPPPPTPTLPSYSNNTGGGMGESNEKAGIKEDEVVGQWR